MVDLFVLMVKMTVSCSVTVIANFNGGARRDPKASAGGCFFFSRYFLASYSIHILRESSHALRCGCRIEAGNSENSQQYMFFVAGNGKQVAKYRSPHNNHCHYYFTPTVLMKGNGLLYMEW